MLTGDAYSSRDLVPSYLELAYVLLVETNPFPRTLLYSENLDEIYKQLHTFLQQNILHRRWRQRLSKRRHLLLKIFKILRFHLKYHLLGHMTYCDHASSVVCRSLDNLHFRLLLQSHMMDFDELGMDEVLKFPNKIILFFG